MGLRQASLTGQALHLLLFLRGGSTGDTPGDIVGDINFAHVVRGAFHAAYLGYELDRAHVRRGLMGEALAACIAHVFRHMNLHRLMANYVPSNEPAGCCESSVFRLRGTLAITYSWTASGRIMC